MGEAPAISPFPLFLMGCVGTALATPPSFLANSHLFLSPQTSTSVNTSPRARMGLSASTTETGNIPACVQKASMGRTVR